MVKGHGTQTGRCVSSDRLDDVNVCEINSWCPVEKDELPLDKAEGALIPGFENYTVFIKNSISFSRFGDAYQRKNMNKKICQYSPDQPPEKLCPIFRYVHYLNFLSLSHVYSVEKNIYIVVIFTVLIST